jgi:hypothetical protein
VPGFLPSTGGLRAQRVGAWLVVLLAASLLAGCGGYVGRARRDYDEGRYLEAHERLAQHEHEVGRLSPRRQAEYGLYRGQALLMLGDYAGAHQWLSFSYDVQRAEPRALGDDERYELDRAWARLAAALAAAQGVALPAGATVVTPGAGPPAPLPPPPPTAPARQPPPPPQR